MNEDSTPKFKVLWAADVSSDSMEVVQLCDLCRAGNIRPNTLIMNESTGNAMPASTFPFLEGPLQDFEDSKPKKKVAQTPVNNIYNNVNVSNKNEKEKGSCWTCGCSFLLLLFLILFFSGMIR